MARFNFAVICIFLIFTPSANAALIERDLFTANDARLTYDTNSGLEWLNLTETLGQSYDAVVGGYGGFISMGFRYAAVEEVRSLYNNVSISQYLSPPTYQEDTAMRDMLIKTGLIWTPECQRVWTARVHGHICYRLN